jgi:glutamine phosphoribosylpyrophosphate amidotransferase
VHGHPDVAIAHNGHITNYYKLRRLYEQRGLRFYTENDSEVIAVYLGQRLSEGMTLEQALTASVSDLDGSFSYLAATAGAVGFARDRFAFKPLLFAETDAFVAVATEEIAIRSAFEGVYRVREAQAKEVRVWQRSSVTEKPLARSMPQ